MLGPPRKAPGHLKPDEPHPCTPIDHARGTSCGHLRRHHGWVDSPMQKSHITQLLLQNGGAFRRWCGCGEGTGSQGEKLLMFLRPLVFNIMPAPERN